MSCKPLGPRSSCRSPGGGRCGCTPPCSWAPPDTTGTQHWGTASAPSLPGQRGRAPAADTHTLVSWNVCCCVHALYTLCTRSKGKGTSCRHTRGLVLERMLLCTRSVHVLYQVKGEGQQLQTHTRLFLGMYVVVHMLCTRSKGKGTSCRRTHALVLECMLLCTRSVPSQRGRAPTADTHICALSWNVSRVYMLSSRSKGKGTNYRHTHTHTHALALKCILLCTCSVPSQERAASTAHRHRHTHMSWTYVFVQTWYQVKSGGHQMHRDTDGENQTQTHMHRQSYCACTKIVRCNAPGDQSPYAHNFG